MLNFLCMPISYQSFDQHFCLNGYLAFWGQIHYSTKWEQNIPPLPTLPNILKHQRFHPFYFWRWEVFILGTFPLNLLPHPYAVDPGPI